jgi:hypothetical protein
MLVVGDRVEPHATFGKYLERAGAGWRWGEDLEFLIEPKEVIAILKEYTIRQHGISIIFYD